MFYCNFVSVGLLALGRPAARHRGAIGWDGSTDSANARLDQYGGTAGSEGEERRTESAKTREEPPISNGGALGGI